MGEGRNSIEMKKHIWRCSQSDSRGRVMEKGHTRKPHEFKNPELNEVEVKGALRMKGF